MVERINFLIKETRGLSYRNYIQLMIAIAIVCAVIHVIQIQLHKSYLKKTEFMKSEITRIRATQKALLKKKPKKIAIGTQEKVAQKLRSSSQWSEFLIDIANAIPRELWLSKISASYQIDKSESAESTNLVFMISGYCYRANVPPLFVSNLQRINKVKAVKNLGTDRGKSGISNLYEFKIKVSLKKPKQGS